MGFHKICNNYDKEKFWNATTKGNITYNTYNNPNDNKSKETYVIIPIWAFRHTHRIHKECFIEGRQTQKKVPIRCICRHFDGSPGSCSYGERCQFFHVIQHNKKHKDADEKENDCEIKMINKNELQKDYLTNCKEEEKRRIYNHHHDSKIENGQDDKTNLRSNCKLDEKHKNEKENDDDSVEGEIIIFQGLDYHEKNVNKKEKNMLEEHNNNIMKKRQKLQKENNNGYIDSIKENKEDETEDFMIEYVNKILDENDDEIT